MRHLIRLLAVSLVLFAPIVFAAEEPAATRVPTQAYQMVKDKSFLKFHVLQNGAPVSGAFKNFDAEIHFDPDMPDRSGVKVEVDTSSVTVSNSDVEQNVKTPDWLSVALFPKATYQADKMTRMPNSQNYHMRGNLTLRGVSKPLVVNFTIEHMDDKRVIATGSSTISRKDFGVGQGDWAKDDVVKNEVRIEFRIVADKK